MIEVENSMKKSFTTGGLSPPREPYVVVVVVLLLLRLLVAFWAAGVARGLDADHVAVPGGRTHGG